MRPITANELIDEMERHAGLHESGKMAAEAAGDNQRRNDYASGEYRLGADIDGASIVLSWLTKRRQSEIAAIGARLVEAVQNMPFVLAAGVTEHLSGGITLRVRYRAHGKRWLEIEQALRPLTNAFPGEAISLEYKAGLADTLTLCADFTWTREGSEG